VTHDQDEAFTISDAVIVMESGKILQYASPDEIYNRPAHPFVASFIGNSTLIDGTIVRVDDGQCVVSVPDLSDAKLISPLASKAVPGDVCKVVIRMSEIHLSHERFPEGTVNVLEGQMTSREFRGGLTDHRVQVGARELVITSHKLCPMVHIGAEVGKAFLSIDKSAISVIVGH
jgi:ABC-type Fe3+/spermidine/putrescine transport system ATPase subunit